MRNNHKFLKINIISCMRSSVNNIHAWARQNIRSCFQRSFYMQDIAGQRQYKRRTNGSIRPQICQQLYSHRPWRKWGCVGQFMVPTGTWAKEACYTCWGWPASPACYLSLPNHAVTWRIRDPNDGKKEGHAQPITAWRRWKHTVGRLQNTRAAFNRNRFRNCTYSSRSISSLPP